MTISRIELYKLNVPLTEPFVISLETIEFAENVLVRIFTDDGLAGYGECSPYRSIAGESQGSAFAVGEELAKILLGREASAIERCLDLLDRHIYGNYCIKSAFDMALYDLAAQRAGQPLYAWLGGANDRELSTDMTVGIGQPAVMAAGALKFKEAGFPAIKIKLGTTTAADVARVEAIRNAVGPELPLRIDANQGWDVTTAVCTLKALETFGIEYCEQPIARWLDHELPRLRARSPIPIMADESLFDHRDALRLARLGACDYFNIKLAKSGGLRNALRITAIADASGIASQVGCFSETRLGITALAHLALSSRNIHHFDMDSPLMLSSDPVEGGVIYQDGGRIQLPDTPGLGARVGESFLKELERMVIE